MALAEAPRIALVKLSSLGDVVHALPLAATLRAARPAAHLTWVVERREAAILREHPALDDVVVADTRGWRRARSAGALGATVREMYRLQRRLAAARFDVAIDAQGLIKSGVLVAATRAPVRVGFAPGRRPRTARKPVHHRAGHAAAAARTWWISAWPCWTRSASASGGTSSACRRRPPPRRW